ncbi:hypothetical protein SAMN04488082_11579 [Desulfomicrobium apsheronum]|uniref:Nuclease homologue n=2 Tax=Desulfomicrobium apsheronum TaxID=52560 RepID=A0A1I3X717_9BACT|nr:hypothetical protein SAMN04488082_11579 [Desulfomicrobium apsheronum]
MNYKRWICKIAVWAALMLLLVILQAEAGWAWTGKVVGIADGDTITVLRDGHDQVKIRLYGIDAPESGQSFGKASKQNLSSMVHGLFQQSMLTVRGQAFLGKHVRSMMKKHEERQGRAGEMCGV